MNHVTPLMAEIHWLSQLAMLLVGISYIAAVFTIPSILLQRRGRPHAAVSWLLVIFALPGLGIFLWWALGRAHLERQRRRRRRAAKKVASSITQIRNVVPLVSQADLSLLPIERMPIEEADWVFPPTAHNRVRLLVDAAEAYPAMETAIREAKNHVHVMFYIWNNDDTGRRWRDLLAEKARAGVQVRLMLDGLGCRAAVRSRMMDSLREAGGEVCVFLPLTLLALRPTINFRNHRKIVVVDGCTGFLGGMNIGDEYTVDWHDLALQIEGPMVDQLQETFVEDWFFATGKEIAAPHFFCRWHAPEKLSGLPPVDDEQAVCSLLASGPHTTHNISHDALFLAVTQAQKRVYITTPYLIPDESTLMALRTAVYRGVDVQVLVPAKNDVPLVRWASRSYFPDLLAAGVRVFEFLPNILHAKSVLIDDDLCMVGSANIDVRSFKLNFEASCLARSRPLADRLLDLFSRNLRQSREVTVDDLRRRSYVTQIGDAAAHLLSPLL